MKYLIIILVFIQINYSFSQLEISPAIGYMVNGKLQFEQGHLDIGNGLSASVALNAKVTNTMDAELDYTYGTKTDLRFLPNNYSTYTEGSTEISTHYITLNAINYFLDEGLLKPYMSLGAGAAIFDIKGLNNVYRFTATAGLGLKYQISSRLGLKLQARFIAPLEFEGAGLYLGISGSGITPGLSLRSSVPIPVGDFRIGINIAL